MYDSVIKINAFNIFSTSFIKILLTITHISFEALAKCCSYFSVSRRIITFQYIVTIKPLRI